jgi:hypothetical protein
MARGGSGLGLIWSAVWHWLGELRKEEPGVIGLGIEIWTRDLPIAEQQCYQLDILAWELLAMRPVTRSTEMFRIITFVNWNAYVVGTKSFRPDIQKPRQMENAVRDI